MSDLVVPEPGEDNGARQRTFGCNRCGKPMATVNDESGTWIFHRCDCPYTATFTAVRDLAWKATPYGETEDGDVHTYIIPKGALHRLVGAMQQDDQTCSVRAWNSDV